MRILIIKLGAIGDVLRTTSILQGLKEKYQSDIIDWITKPSSKEILLHDPYLQQTYIWEERGQLDKYDLVVSLEDEYEACELASNLNAKKLLGTFVKQGKISYTPSGWFDMSAISKYGFQKANALKQKNKKTFQQHMADLLGIKVGAYIYKQTMDEIEYGRKYVRNLGIEKKERVVGVNTGAGKRWQQKSLSIEKTIELINRLTKELGVVSLILGGEEEKERNAIIAKETGMPNGGSHSLRNFAGVIGQGQAVVSSDSLAMHFAIALKKRLVVFFGPTSPTEIELYGLGVKLYPKMDCLACYIKKCEKNPNCMDMLSVEDLFSAIKRELNK